MRPIKMSAATVPAKRESGFKCRERLEKDNGVGGIKVDHDDGDNNPR